ncbi:MAG TPA: methyltransferase domain-containing protein, partial [Anaerolineaceae bacterium]|nr:methyltransferase domain-containing protein [Anaerolineaceae bacterium]
MTAIPRSSAEFYKKATAFWNYPEVPYGPALRGMIRPTDVVADIGCGIGIVSRYLAGLCRRVIAIDRDETALDVLRAELSGEDCGNIEVVH